MMLRLSLLLFWVPLAGCQVAAPEHDPIAATPESEVLAHAESRSIYAKADRLQIVETTKGAESRRALGNPRRVIAYKHGFEIPDATYVLHQAPDGALRRMMPRALASDAATFDLTAPIVDARAAEKIARAAVPGAATIARAQTVYLRDGAKSDYHLTHRFELVLDQELELWSVEVSARDGTILSKRDVTRREAWDGGQSTSPTITGLPLPVLFGRPPRNADGDDMNWELRANLRDDRVHWLRADYSFGELRTTSTYDDSTPPVRRAENVFGWDFLASGSFGNGQPMVDPTTGVRSSVMNEAGETEAANAHLAAMLAIGFSRAVAGRDGPIEDSFQVKVHSNLSSRWIPRILDVGPTAHIRRAPWVSPLVPIDPSDEEQLARGCVTSATLMSVAHEIGHGVENAWGGGASAIG
jgi:hypothetical protein